MNFLFKPVPNWITRILKTLTLIFGGLVLFLFIIQLILGLIIDPQDKKEDKNRAESYYNKQNKKYGMTDIKPFGMVYTYDVKTNVGFFSGGGFLENNCWERYIRDSWWNQGISISLCENENITKEKLEALYNFWKEYDKIFRSKDKIRDDYFK